MGGEAAGVGGTATRRGMRRVGGAGVAGIGSMGLHDCENRDDKGEMVARVRISWQRGFRPAWPAMGPNVSHGPRPGDADENR